MSPRAKRISGFKNFRSPPQKDFCNKICHVWTAPGWQEKSLGRRLADSDEVARV
jgi:hypothetical protein